MPSNLAPATRLPDTAAFERFCEEAVKECAELDHLVEEELESVLLWMWDKILNAEREAYKLGHAEAQLEVEENE